MATKTKTPKPAASKPAANKISKDTAKKVKKVHKSDAVDASPEKAPSCKGIVHHVALPPAEAKAANEARAKEAQDLAKGKKSKVYKA